MSTTLFNLRINLLLLILNNLNLWFYLLFNFFLFYIFYIFIHFSFQMFFFIYFFINTWSWLYLSFFLLWSYVIGLYFRFLHFYSFIWILHDFLDLLFFLNPFLITSFIEILPIKWNIIFFHNLNSLIIQIFRVKSIDIQFRTWFLMFS